MSEKTEMNLFMGPQHPSMHGLWALRLTIDGETIVNSDAQIGYLHRSYEKLLANRTYEQGIPITDRLCYVESHSYSVGYAYAIEGIYQIEAPEKANWIRIMTLEMQRIASHCLWLGAFSVDLGALTMLIYPMNAREHMIGLLESITGARLTYNYSRIGGVYKDLPHDYAGKIERSLEEFNVLQGEFKDLLEETQIFRIRSEGIGPLSAEDALSFGASGPMLRASGVPFDVRKQDPYMGYDQIDFKVHTRTEGDSYARYRVRLDEIEESMSIILQALDKYNELKPSDPYRLEKVPRRPPEGESYRRIECARGELGYFFNSNGTPTPYRVRIRSPTFNNLQTLSPLVKGGKLADVPAVMGTVDICVGDLDK
jgi:NADH-quinone oxidoreductase subunit D